MDNRPIKSKGKYNLNFIDWNNEWERVSEIENKIINNEYVSDDEEYNRVKSYLEKEARKRGLHIKPDEIIISKQKLKELIKKGRIECYICINEFKEKDSVIQLDCSHLFCSKCILKWFQQNSNCPICKKDFKVKKMNKFDENNNYDDDQNEQNGLDIIF